MARRDIRSSRAIERLCGRDAGYRFIVGDAVPDHTVIARFRQRHVAHMLEVFTAVLRLCREAGLIRLGLVALDGTKVRANAALDANRTASSVDEQVARMLAEAEATDAQEDRQFGAQRGDELPAALARRGDRLARLRLSHRLPLRHLPSEDPLAQVLGIRLPPPKQHPILRSR